MTEKSRIKQRKTIQDKYGKDHYKWLAEQRWKKPNAKEKIREYVATRTRDNKGKFVKKLEKETENE